MSIEEVNHFYIEFEGQNSHYSTTIFREKKQKFSISEIHGKLEYTLPICTVHMEQYRLIDVPHTMGIGSGPIFERLFSAIS